MEGNHRFMKDFRSGSESAFNRFMEEHMKPLTFFASGILDDYTLAEEIVSDSFIKLYNRRSNFPTPAAVKAFLYITTRNACYDYLKSATYKRVVNRAVLNEDLINPDQDTLHRIIYGELVQLLYEEIERLPERQATIIKLTYLEGISTEEITTRLDMTVNAVKLSRSRAKRTLKAIFGERRLLVLMALLKILLLQ